MCDWVQVVVIVVVQGRDHALLAEPDVGFHCERLIEVLASCWHQRLDVHRLQAPHDSNQPHQCRATFPMFYGMYVEEDTCQAKCLI